MAETNTTAAPAEGVSAESAPAPQPGAENPDGLKEQAGVQPEVEGEQQPKEGEAKAGTPKGVQKRLDELTRQRGEAQRMNERLLSVLERTLTTGKAPATEAPSGPPKREQFETYEQYLDAKSDYRTAEAVQIIEQKAIQARQQEAAQRRDSDWQSKLQKTASEIEDFADVVYADNLPISQAMVTAMQDSDLGPQIAYHLGKNPSDAQRISQLSPAAQVREIGKIERDLELKKAAPAKKASGAPPPIEPVGSSKGGLNGSADSMTQAEYEAVRKKQGARWARG